MFEEPTAERPGCTVGGLYSMNPSLIECHMWHILYKMMMMSIVRTACLFQ